MIAELSAGFQGLKTALGIAESLNSANTQAQVNDVKLALQGCLLDAQRALFAAQETEAAATRRIDGLEQEIAKLKDWEGLKERYELKAIDLRAFAYVTKPGMENGEPPHWLCTDCFERRQRSFLQYRKTVQGVGRTGLQALWGCSACRMEVSVYFQRNPAPGTEDQA